MNDTDAARSEITRLEGLNSSQNFLIERKSQRLHEAECEIDGLRCEVRRLRDRAKEKAACSVEYVRLTDEHFDSQNRKIEELNTDAAAMRRLLDSYLSDEALMNWFQDTTTQQEMRAALDGSAGKKLAREHAELVEWAKEVIACQHNCDHNEPHEPPAGLAPAADGGGE